MTWTREHDKAREIMPNPKPRLTPEQRQRAINEAMHIDCSVHEWPNTPNDIWLVCSGYLDALAEIERLIDASDVFCRAYRVGMEPFGSQIEQFDGIQHWLPHGWPSVADLKKLHDVAMASRRSMYSGRR